MAEPLDGGVGRAGKRGLVEDRPALDTALLRGMGRRHAAGERVAWLGWAPPGAHRGVVVGLVLGPSPGAGVLRISHPTARGRAGYEVALTTTPCPFGGSRWWLVCPAPGCGRRSGKLYLVGTAFACRLCHRLVYASTRR